MLVFTGVVVKKGTPMSARHEKLPAGRRYIDDILCWKAIMNDFPLFYSSNDELVVDGFKANSLIRFLQALICQRCPLSAKYHQLDSGQ